MNSRKPARMFIVRISDIFFIKAHGMVLAGQVENGRVRIGASAILRTPKASIPVTIAGVERDRRIVPSASQGESVALMIQDIHPSQLPGGVEVVESNDKGLSPWRVIDLVVEGAPKHWWEFWK